MKTIIICCDMFNIDFEFKILDKENIDDVIRGDGFDLTSEGTRKGFTVLTTEGIKCYLLKKRDSFYVHEVVHAVDFVLDAKGLLSNDVVANSELRAYMVTYLLDRLMTQLNKEDNMPAKSIKQRRAMAIAEHHPEELNKKNKGLKKMSKSQLHDFAATKETKLPMTVKKKKSK